MNLPRLFVSIVGQLTFNFLKTSSAFSLSANCLSINYFSLLSLILEIRTLYWWSYLLFCNTSIGFEGWAGCISVLGSSSLNRTESIFASGVLSGVTLMEIQLLHFQKRLLLLPRKEIFSADKFTQDPWCQLLHESQHMELELSDNSAELVEHRQVFVELFCLFIPYCRNNVCNRFISIQNVFGT